MYKRMREPFLPDGVTSLREIARIHTLEAVETILAVMRTSEKEKVRMEAAQMLLDRGWGKVQPLPLFESDGDPDGRVATLTERIRKITLVQGAPQVSVSPPKIIDVEPAPFLVERQRPSTADGGADGTDG